jgi:spore germination protein
MRYFTFKRGRSSNPKQNTRPSRAHYSGGSRKGGEKPGAPGAAKPATPKPTETKVPLAIDRDYAVSLQTMKKVFSDCSDVIFREISVTPASRGFIVFIDGIVKSEEISDHTLLPLFALHSRISDPEELEQETLIVPQTAPCPTYEEAADNILAGNAVLFIQGHDHGITINARGGARRGVEEPQTESVIRGPREGFVENLRTNTALLRFKIKSSDLKMKSFVIGDKTKTSVLLAYIEGIIDPKLVEEATRRLQEIKIDGVLESGYIEELIEDQPFSPFPQLQYTERPDAAAAGLLEGRFAIFVDGTPFVLVAPVTFWQFMQASEDYYERYIIGNLIRWLRMVFIAVALFLPALYVAVTTFQQDMLPSNLLLSIAAARESIPFPAIVEALIMEVAFEALREAGIRLPKTVGQAVSILGALVIGQAAVQAGIVSAPMVIVVSLTGIASFTIPRFNMAISIRLLRFPLMILAGIFGLFGIVVGLVLISVHLCSLRSFGVPYLSGIAPYQHAEQQDIMVRSPWWKMVFRPNSLSQLNRRRLSTSHMPQRKQPGGSS